MTEFRSSSRKTKHDSVSWVKELVIRFEDGREEHFYISLTKTGTFVVPSQQNSTGWTQLDFQKCPCCPLSSSDVECCPAAESLETTLLRLKDHFSYEKVTAKMMDSENRTTVVEWQLQEVGSTFVQLAVFSTSCPIGKQFKPLIKDLRPFATNDELSKHLVGKFLLKHRGKREECQKDIIGKMEPLRIVFSQLAKRLSGNTGGDAMANSIVRLDAFALNVSLLMDEVFDELSEEMGWESESSSSPPSDGSVYQEHQGHMPPEDRSSDSESPGVKENEKRNKFAAAISKLLGNNKKDQ